MVKSSHPGKQRMAVYQADNRTMGKLMGSHLSKELRKKYEQSTAPVRVGDNVKVMRGDHKGKNGKVTEVDRKRNKVFLQGFSHKKTDGKEAFVSFRPSNLLITGTETKDKKRFKKTQPAEKKETETTKEKSDSGKEKMPEKSDKGSEK